MIQIAIVGAGIAGMAAARRLGTAGFQCTVFEKSRGLGGRMATRRVDDLQFDHGAQFFSVHGARFGEIVADWQAKGAAAGWFDGAFVGTPGMTAPVRAMAGQHTIVLDTRVASLMRDVHGWTLRTDAGAVGTSGNGHFAVVILAIPAPQLIPLAATAQVTFPDLERVRYAPCWALMIAFDKTVSAIQNKLAFDDGPIRWIARDSSKPGRSSQKDTFVVHASPEWSRRHLELSAEDAARELIPHFRAAAGVDAQPIYVAAHRWRYAQVEETAGSAYLWNADVQLGACGDWALGPRIEAAFDSGDALADRIIAKMGTAHGV